ncbi:MAG: cytochrome c oxidase subunit 2A [Caldilineaceae bacterium]
MNEPDTPKGTLALLAFFVLLTLFLWGFTYMTMLSRGVTQ